MPKELEMLEVQPLGKRNGKTYIVIWLWCKSQKSLRQLRELAKSDQLLKRLDILMTFFWSRGTQRLHDLVFRREKLSLQLLKTLRLETMQFKRTVAVRQLSMKLSGVFNLLRHSRAFTSLDDKIYVLTHQTISIHQDASPYARQSETVFPSPESTAVYPGYREAQLWFIEACNQTKHIYVARSHEQRVWKLTASEYNLEVWMHYMAIMCSLSVTSDGKVLFLKYERQEDLPDAYCMEIYTKDAVLLYNINLGLPSSINRPISRPVEISPGNFAINGRNILLVKSVNFNTMTTTDQNLIRCPDDERNYGRIDGIALYSVSRLITVLHNKLAILDSQLNVEITSSSFAGYAEILHYRKDKRQLMTFSSSMSSVLIYTLQYEGEDMLADDV